MESLTGSEEGNVKKASGIATLRAAMVLVFVLCVAVISCAASDSTSPVPEVPVKGKVTMVDIGARKCIPCKMMAPVMEELEKEYHDSGKAAIIFIDVWVNKDQGRKFGIRAIPTQIFYNKEGKEVYRHEGFMDKKAIVARLEEMGVK